MSTVLIVDDSPVERRLVAGLLEKDSGLDVAFASDGVAALKHLSTSTPDLVLTDLRMPNMDGLQLVHQIRVHHTNVPVVLMTAHGSEAVAIEALRAGAASYVPKLMLADSLYRAVEQVLSISTTTRTATALSKHLRETELSFVLPNEPVLIDPLVRLIRHHTRGVGLCDETRGTQMGVALEHGLLNALYRGNLEITPEEIDAACESQLHGEDGNTVATRAEESPYCDRRIHIDIAITKQAAHFTIQDDGPGFDVQKLGNPTAESISELNRGRGILLMKALMDEVIYNEKGNQVILVKHREN